MSSHVGGGVRFLKNEQMCTGPFATHPIQSPLGILLRCSNFDPNVSPYTSPALRGGASCIGHSACFDTKPVSRHKEVTLGTRACWLTQKRISGNRDVTVGGVLFDTKRVGGHKGLVVGTVRVCRHKTCRWAQRRVSGRTVH